MDICPSSTLVINPDELGPDPAVGMELAVQLGIGHLEIRSAEGANAITLPSGRLRHIRTLADERGLVVAALASPLWKWCRPEATPGRVDTFGFPTQVPAADRLGWVERAIEAARILGASIVRIFSQLRVEPHLTEQLHGDPLLAKALEVAGTSGVRLLLENEPVCTVAHAEPLLEVLHRYHGQGLGLWLDVANLHEVGQANSETIRALAPYVAYVHVKDFRPVDGGGRAFCPAGTGVVPYDQILPLLHAARPGLPYALETHARYPRRRANHRRRVPARGRPRRCGVRRVLLVGAGEVGAKHLAALTSTPGLFVAGVADPAPAAEPPPGIPVFASWRPALKAVAPDLVVVAAPPGTALSAARDAAAAGAAVLVEKPAATDPAALAPRAGDGRVFVAFQPHFAPGLHGLLAERPAVIRAEVVLAVQRDPGYFRGWRRTYTTAGGVLHQQAIHGLALALRLIPGNVETVDAEVVHRRGLAETEDHVTAAITVTGGRTVHIDARVDHHGRPRHELVVHLTDGRRLHVRGRNLEAGLGEPGDAPTHQELRRAMYAAVLASAKGPVHPCLFPLSALRRPLEVIDRVHRNARVVLAAHAAAV